MEFDLDNATTIILSGVVFTLGLFYIYMTYNFDYWKKKGVSYAKPSFPFGNIGDLLQKKTHVGKMYETFYRHYKGEKYVGIFEGRNPTLIIRDLDLAQRILVKDFDCFMDRNHYPKARKDFLALALFTLQGEEWKFLRSKLASFYTERNLKNMYGVLQKYSIHLKSHLDSLVMAGGKINVVDTLTKFTMNIASASVLGVESDSMEPDKELYDVFKCSMNSTSMPLVKKFTMTNFPWLSKQLAISPFTSRQREFYLKFVVDNIQDRKVNSIRKHDMFDILMSLEGIYAVQLLFHTSTEVTAFVISTALFELARDDTLQRRVQEEVDATVEAHGGNITDDSLKDMPFMEQVIYETMRHPRSTPALDRLVVKPYKLPDSDVILDTGVKVVIPVFAIHHDPAIYPDPQTFDPERFSVNNSLGRHKLVFLGFGAGPRMCLGKRMAIKKAKLAIATVMRHFHLSEATETVPLNSYSHKFIPGPTSPVILRIAHRNT